MYECEREMPTTPEEGATFYDYDEPETFWNDDEFENWARRRPIARFPYWRGGEF